MSFWDISYNKYGIFIESDFFQLNFGNINSSRNIIHNFQQGVVHEVSQFHSDIVIDVNSLGPNDPPLKADGMHTELSKISLLIKTADCVPTMIFDFSNKSISSIHAGWRGVAQSIVCKAISNFHKNSNELWIFFGPCIQKNSFEIKKDTLDILLSTVKNHTILNVDQADNHYYLSLIDLIKIQINDSFENKTIKWWDSKIDTKSDSNYHSFRRHPNSSDRNFSAISKKSISI